MDKQNIILKVEKNSIADEMGIEPGDVLIDINGKSVQDVFDYRYLIQDEFLEVGILKSDGEEWILEIEKDEFDDIGIVFEKGLMDKAKSCSNKCIFCFIDQLPKGMRDSLYFKDDDSRLSFLQGNYVTLTNMKQEDLDRVIFYHLSPINISVHTTNMELRKFMIKNPNSVKLMDYLEQLNKAGIEMNYQIVLCKGVNDGDELDRTINDLSRFIPNGVCVAVVPLGMTKYREGLHPFELYNKAEAQNIIKQIEKWQKKFKKEFGTKFVFAADEFYLTAEAEIPNADFYEGFPQLEDGIGMISLMREEFDNYFTEITPDSKKRHVTLATGKSAFNFISGLCRKIEKKFVNTNIDVYLIENDFFGKNITVSGLLTGTDIINQLKNKTVSDYLLIPENSLRSNDTVFLDDIDIKDLEKELNTKVIISPSDGREFINNILFAED